MARKLNLIHIPSLKALGHTWLRSGLMWTKKEYLIRTLADEDEGKAEGRFQILDGSFWVVQIVKKRGRAAISVVSNDSGRVVASYTVSPRALMELRAVKRWYPGAWVQMVLDYSDAVETENNGDEGFKTGGKGVAVVREVERAIAESER